MSEQYKYVDVPLEPRIAKDLIVTLMAGKTVSRKEIITQLITYHHNNGGKETNTNKIGTVKKALQYLQNEGLATQSIGKGIWTISGEAPAPAPPPPPAPAPPPPPAPAPQAMHLVLGRGSGTVYIYTFPSHMTAATDCYPHKIGFTEDSDPGARIRAQTGTASIEPPVICLLIHSDEPQRLEKALHAILHYQGRHIPDNKNKEWFNTNVNQICALYFMIEQNRQLT